MANDLELLLASIGLKPHMIWREDAPDIYDKEQFAHYVDPGYRGSALAENDEVYRMAEHVLMHDHSGVRATVTTTESYRGDEVDYKVLQVFILLADGRKVDVLGIDMGAKKVSTREGTVPFAEVNKVVGGA